MNSFCRGYHLGPSINGLVTDRIKKLCCPGFILALFQSTTANKIDSKYKRLLPRGGTLVFSHIRRLGLFFGVQNSEFQYFWGFQKNEYFFGYEDFVDIFFGVFLG